MRTRRKTKSRFLLLFVGLLFGVLIGEYVWLQRNLEPMPKGPTRYVRWEATTSLDEALRDLQQRGVVRNVAAAKIFAWIRRSPGNVATGTYQVAPGDSVAEVLRSLRSPIRQMLRVPETNWARRTARLLEKRDVLNANEYMSLIQHPDQFRQFVSFPLPPKSLEGYLYPDTYDLPPLIGAKAVIVRQLEAFQKQIWDRFHQPPDLDRLLTEASMVQMEAGNQTDAPKVAGVIENRLAKNMRLQIDATICYALQKWRRLTFADYKDVLSPYNTYLHDGLPPGPICSPTWKSFQAALHPEQSKNLFYVALPDGQSIFSATYAEHLHNIRLRRKAIKELSKP